MSSLACSQSRLVEIWTWYTSQNLQISRALQMHVGYFVECTGPEGGEPTCEWAQTRPSVRLDQLIITLVFGERKSLAQVLAIVYPSSYQPDNWLGIEAIQESNLYGAVTTWCVALPRDSFTQLTWTELAVQFCFKAIVVHPPWSGHLFTVTNHLITRITRCAPTIHSLQFNVLTPSS